MSNRETYSLLRTSGMIGKEGKRIRTPAWKGPYVNSDKTIGKLPGATPDGSRAGSPEPEANPMGLAGAAQDVQELEQKRRRTEGQHKEEQRNKIEELRKEAEEQRKEAEELRKTVSEKGNKILDLQTMVAEKASEAAHNKNQLTGAQAELEKAKAELEKANAELARRAMQPLLDPAYMQAHKMREELLKAQEELATAENLYNAIKAREHQAKEDNIQRDSAYRTTLNKNALLTQQNTLLIQQLARTQKQLKDAHTFTGELQQLAATNQHAQFSIEYEHEHVLRKVEGNRETGKALGWGLRN